ncbi:MAG: hypothetical protein QM657_10715 [Lacrimispora sp.]|uniref:hypothetical protein n=1 Tax=Lacrimispora sp. TaxID=2719234 RepID=UPI0039E5ADE6
MKKFKLLLLTTAMSLAMSVVSFAGQWKQDTVGWWYQNDDGTYSANSWQWIDGNSDGVSEYYYFNENGYCLMNTTTPDGKTVNSDGALIVSGVVQTKATAASTTTAAQPTQGTSQNTATTNNKEKMVWKSRTGTKYHSNPNCSNMKNPSHVTQSEAEADGRTPCSKCY